MSLINKTYPVTGMSCASCATSVESMLKAQKGVKNAAVNYASKNVIVQFSPDEISEQALKDSVISIGYDIIITKSKEEVEEMEKKVLQNLKRNVLLSGVFSVSLVIIGMFFMDMPYANYIMWGVATPVLVFWGKNFYVNAYKQLKHKSVNMDTLVALSTGIAYLFSVFNTLYPQFWHQRGLHAHVYFESTGVIIFFILLGKLLEENAKSRTSDAIKKLIGLQPKTVSVVDEKGSVSEISIEDVQVGQIILIKPGGKIPVDGIVVDGESFVDESMISGEPIAVLKQKEAKIFSGTINQKGTFKFKATKVGSETLLAQIIKTVQEAQGSKAPVQKLTDKIASVFVPIVVGISILSLILWVVLGGENGLTQGLLAMITVLVIACPCALGLATPTALMVGIGRGAGLGILIKDAEALESAREIDAIVVDKTGTLTEGRPVVIEMNFSNSNAQEFKQVLYGIELLSEHPLAAAICNEFKEKNIKPIKPDSFESITGKGIKAVIGTKVYVAGNLKLMHEFKIEISETEQKIINQLEEQGQSVVAFGSDGKLIASIGISDKIKINSKEAISTLHALGIEIYMLTGDNEQSAKTIGAKVGINNIHANLLPADKSIFIKQLQKEGKKVAMIGDGINDSEALAQSDVSFAMGKGSDIAIDVAKVTIMSSDLAMVPKAIQLSKFTVAKIKQNLFWAFIYNLIGIPVAAGTLYFINGFMLNPMIAGAAMALSSVSVVSNSLLLKFKKLN